MALKTSTGRRGRPHLGDREVVKVGLYPSEVATVDGLRGPVDRSTFLAEILAEHVGRGDLLNPRHQLTLLNVDAGSAAQDAPSGDADDHVLYATARVHPEVRGEIERRRGRLPQATYNAQVVRARLGLTQPAMTVRRDQEGMLRLAM
ncbi:hypothetical protein [Mycolicibacterium brumae]|uniref:Uncharacterized protein n=1 Tax=Mycolicibacterium brumae TaxID=85968 RepID=A0A2G5P502_9MYCO|nr:hypothetical protein [Mycolicibacterium brumae]MCV7191367.1 hypothetical protein [Mycolicibacterium brumae]PIB73113.1 hypothetical protein CQY22_018260 [Mycolicibacterium brumae]RWA17039.1 hypothetical protein MBRU_18885 [Mycolicibacterium brumae DSM 44177]UWW08162.1 hypothetical protein L2Z93_001205 [Mycolicibacterium brumae]